MEDLKSVIPAILHRNLGKIEKVRSAWESIGWKELLSNTFPYRTTSSTIYIAVTHPIWKNEIINNSDRILKKINKLTGENFSRIIVDVNTSFFQKKRSSGRENKKLREPLTAEDIRELISKIKSDRIRSRLTSLLEKMEERRKNGQP